MQSTKKMNPSSSSSNAGLGLKKGAWTAEEDMILKNYIEKYGEGKWHLVPLRTGLNRCRKSCRLRWLNYLNPDIKRGDFGEDEVDLILRLHKLLGNRWSLIAGRIPGRTANDVKNYWNTHIHSRSRKNKELKDHGLLPETTVTIIKPQPSKFSNTVNPYIGDDPHILAREGGSLIKSSNDGTNNKFNMSSIISSPNVPDNNINEYLDDLLNDREKEIDNEIRLSFGFSGGEALNVVEKEDDNDNLFDFPMDDIDSIWKFIDFGEP